MKVVLISMKGLMMQEVFVPVYLSNICHSSCNICNMSRQNRDMLRIKGTPEQFEEQLYILYNIENIRAICLLTGEYIDGEKRRDNFEFVLYCINRALEYGFNKVFFNIGSLTDFEMDLILDKFSNDSRLVLSLFQETYNEDLYKDVFGSLAADNPKSDFYRRLSTPQRWIEKGFKNVDIGILLGLGGETIKDIEKLIEHATKLYDMGATVYISLPRIYHAGQITQLVSDADFMNYIKFIKQKCKWAKIIVTTRETIEMIRELMPHVDVISPGSSDVMPYTRSGTIPNNENTSQFQIAQKRKRPSDILKELCVESNISKMTDNQHKKRNLNVLLGGPIQYISNSDNIIDTNKQGIIQSLINAMTSEGITVFSAHAEEQYGLKIPSVQEVCRRDFKWMNNCDVFCLMALDNGEHIVRSDGSCIELGWASSMNKPILILVDPDMLDNASYLLQGLVDNFKIKTLSIKNVIQDPSILVKAIHSMHINPEAKISLTFEV